MPLSELNGLDDDLLNLFADELRSKKKSKKTRRKVKSVFDELDRFDAEDTSSRDGEKESSFLKTKSSFLKSVKFNDSIEVKVPESPPFSGAEREEEENGNNSAQKESVNLSQTDHSESFYEISNPDHLFPEQLPGKTGHSETEIDEPSNNDGKSLTVKQPEVLTSTKVVSPSPKSVVPDELKSVGSGLTESLQYYEAQEVLPTVADPADEDMHGALPTADEKTGEDKPESFEDQMSGDAKRTPHPRFQRSTSANHLRDMQLIMDTKCENSYVSTVVLTSTEMNKMLDGKSPKDVAIISDSRRPPKSPALRKRPSSCQSLQRLSTNYPVLPNRVVDGDTDGATIRAMAYQAWYARQARCARQERIASLQREAEDAKKQREELAKTEQNRKAFLSWKAQKRSYFREQLRRRKEEEEARQRKEDEQNRRKRESDHAFDVWKAQKDTILRKQQQDMQTKNRAQSDNKTYEESQKRAEAERAFQAWKTKKEAEIREANYQRHKHETDEEKKKSEEARKKSEQAAEAYYQWELRKLVELRDASGSSRGNLDTLKVSSMECLRPGTAKGSSTERAPWRPSSSRPNSSTRLVI